jgi:hypothetical protein
MAPEWSIVSSLFAALVGGFLVHFLTLRRDTRTESRKLRVELLMRAYRTIVATVDHGAATKDDSLALTQAMNDLVLLGTPEQVELVQMTLDSGMRNNGDFDFTQLMLSLRTDLRNELGLMSSVFEEEAPKFFAFAPPAKGNSRRTARVAKEGLRWEIKAEAHEVE